MKSKGFIEKILEKADVKINGDRPWDIQVLDERFYRRVALGGSLAFGESYMDGWWECAELDECINRIIRARLVETVSLTPAMVFQYFKWIFTNPGHKSKAFEVGEEHYDTGNDLFEVMLDKQMVYTCGYWKSAQNLDEAQENKLDLVCRKIGLKAGDRVLDIGCGWGSFAKFAAEKYGASVVGLTISKEQAELARNRCAGLPVEIRLQDYRDIDEKFDHIISLGMFEHVGRKNYVTYMNVAKRCLKENGLFLLHTIGDNKTTHAADPWIEKYIFPNGKLPSFSEIAKATDGFFVVEDWHNFGTDYDKTLCAWYTNFEKHWPELSKNYSGRFYRMWRFYLLSCAGAFRARNIQLWQIVLSPNGVVGGYESVR